MKVEERTLSVREAAIVLSVDQETVKRWLRSGLFETAYKDKSNIWRIPKELVDKLPKTKKMDSRIIKANLKYVGEKYNELTILEITDYMKDGTNKKLAVVAGCECGNKVVKPLYQIINGIIKCCSNECVTKSGFKPGDRYGFLTILGDAGLRNYGEQRNNRWIKAICDCGTETEKPLKRLKSGEVNSCGKHCRLHLIDIVGQKFNHLTVLKEVEREVDDKKHRLFLCKCDCGEERVKRYNKLVGNYTQCCDLNCYYHKGEHSVHWKPNITMEDRLIGRDYWEYRQWVRKVFERDKFTCQYCLKRGRGNLEAHHKDGYGWCVERRIDVTNGVTLCEECHINFHKIYGYRDSTEEQYEEWIKSKSDINPLLIETLADVCVPQAFLLTGSDIGGENSKSPY